MRECTTRSRHLNDSEAEKEKHWRPPRTTKSGLSAWPQLHNTNVPDDCIYHSVINIKRPMWRQRIRIQTSDSLTFQSFSVNRNSIHALDPYTTLAFISSDKYTFSQPEHLNMTNELETSLFLSLRSAAGQWCANDAPCARTFNAFTNNVSHIIFMKRNQFLNDSKSTHHIIFPVKSFVAHLLLNPA